MSEHTAGLGDARDQALAVRALYEVLEERFNGKTWSSHELMIGFSNLDDAFTTTMDTIRSGLEHTIERTTP